MGKRKSKPANRPAATINPRILVRDHVSVKQCRHGLMMYNLNDLFVGKALDIYGEWCEAELVTLGQVLRAGDVVLDVGANIGTHTVFFSTMVTPSGMVYAIEPQRVTYEFLCANIALNGLLNVIPMQAGIGEEPGELTIPVLDPASPQNFAALSIEGHSSGDVVKVLPVDSLGLKRCKLIKIDVEGMEFQVLRGAEKTIRSCRPFLFVENNTREGAPTTVQELFDLDYKCWWHIANYYNPNNFFQNKDNVFAAYVPESNMICAPTELNLNVTGFEPVTGPTDTWVQALARLGVYRG